MKAGTLKLCLPIIAMTAQQSMVSLVLPPFLESLKYSVAAIGALISVGPILALAARLPSGLAYRGERARILMTAALSIVILSNLLYPFSVTPLYFALVHALNGLALGAAMTIYLALFVEALPPDEDRRHAMGYYAGSLAIGYSTGGFGAGYVADKLGYFATFASASQLGLLCIVMLFFLSQPPAHAAASSRAAATTPLLLDALKSVLEPKVAAMVVIHLFLNMMHQLGMIFLPLYGLAVGLSLTQVGIIKGLYSLCNAITRPLSGLVMKQLSHQRVSRVGLPLQAALMTLIPFFHEMGPLLSIFVLVGFLRAIAIVANTISLVEDVDATRVSRGVASGIYSAAGDMGNILGPSVGGIIAGFTGIASLFFIGPTMIALTFLASLWASKFLRAPIAPRSTP